MKDSRFDEDMEKLLNMKKGEIVCLLWFDGGGAEVLKDSVGWVWLYDCPANGQSAFPRCDPMTIAV